MNNETSVPVIRPEWLAGITMTQAQKDQWLAALRSGDYPQGSRALFDGGFCCLGVCGSAVLGVSNKNLRFQADLTDVGFPDFLGPWRSDGDAAFDSDQRDTWTSIQRVLAGPNDTGWPFAQIANFIEANIPACDAVKS